MSLKNFWWLAGWVGLLSLGRASAEPKTDAQLHGQWTLSSLMVEGQEVAGLHGATLEFKKDGTKLFTLPGGKVEQGTYRCEGAKAPKWMDTTTDGKAEQGKGIYAIDKKGELRICLCVSGQFRPEKFRAQGGDGTMLLTLTRREDKKEKNEPKAPPKLSGEFSKEVPKTPRTFRMGFTGFVYDTTLEAVTASRAFCRENGDILAHHIEGVPWATALAGEELPAAVRQSWTDKKLATPEGGKVYLAISPGRGDLKVIEKGGKLPAEFRGRSYAHPKVKEAYLNYCRSSISFFKPDYLAIGIEVNEIHSSGVRKWEAYVELHKYVYAELKKDHPKLPIFASFTLHNMYKKKGAMLEQFKKLMPFNDLVAVSYYPFFIGGPERLTSLDWMMEQFREFGKPFAMVETNDAAEELRFPKAGYLISGTPEKQFAYYQRLLELAEKEQFSFVISFVHQDYDALWKKIEKGSPELFMAWRDCGFLDEKGRERPALSLWRAHFARLHRAAE